MLASDMLFCITLFLVHNCFHPYFYYYLEILIIIKFGFSV